MRLGEDRACYQGGVEPGRTVRMDAGSPARSALSSYYLYIPGSQGGFKPSNPKRTRPRQVDLIKPISRKGCRWFVVDITETAAPPSRLPSPKRRLDAHLSA